MPKFWQYTSDIGAAQDFSGLNWIAMRLRNWRIFCYFSLTVLVACGGGGETRMSLDSMFPARGSETGGSQVQLFGKGFSPGVQVKIDGQDCESVTLIGGSSLTCTTKGGRLGAVDVRVIAPDGDEVSSGGMFAYRPSGIGISSYGVVATLPMAGTYSKPFSAKLESVVAGFDVASLTRSWIIDGKLFNEGESVEFAEGAHKVTLTLQDKTGDRDQFSYEIVVGNTVYKKSSTGVDKTRLYKMTSAGEISVINTGNFPLLNPRFIGLGRPDYVDWARYLKSLAVLNGLPNGASEKEREMLLESAWRDLSNSTSHACSPGRESEEVIDPVMLVRGYGYGCCSNAARALAYLGSFMDIPARVRSTRQHEFPEFTINGSTFVLDPDLRLRYWSGGVPLGAWPSEEQPISLMNVRDYLAQTSLGKYYEVSPGGFLPYGSDPSYAEDLIRSFYFNDIVGEVVWGHREAFTGSHYVLNPGEKLAYSLESDYVPLHRIGGDSGSSLPRVGKAVYRKIFALRNFERAGENKIVPVNNIPYPIQDLVVRSSKPFGDKDVWLLAGGGKYAAGRSEATAWTVSAEELRKLSSVSDLAIVISDAHELVAIEIGMQFNPQVLRSGSEASSVKYLDDSGQCGRNLMIAGADGREAVSLGTDLCNAQDPQVVETHYALARGESGLVVVSGYGTSYGGEGGISTPAGGKGGVELTLPRTPGLTGALRAATEGMLLNWEIYQDGNWITLHAIDVSSSQWITLPPTSSSTSLLRATLRNPPARETTYLSYLSLKEGRNGVGSPYAVVLND